MGYNHINTKLMEATEDTIKSLLDEGGIQANNLDFLYKLSKIHNNLAEEEHWCMEMESEGNEMRYGNYGTYGDHDGVYGRRERDSRGRYMDGRRYRGHEHLDRMYDTYGRYMEGHERYGANEDTKRSLKYMLESMEDFARMLREDAQSQEEIEMIRQTAQRIANM